MNINSYIRGLLSLFFLFPKPSFQVSYNPPPVPNPRLQNAFTALQAWKHAIIDDPKGFTSNWNGHAVCNYIGVYCTPALDNAYITTVARIYLNYASISSLPEELGLVTDLALFHINSNKFCGTLPSSFRDLRLLYELDVSNNLSSGKFPYVVLCLPSLKFLDIRFNKFNGKVPSALFDQKLDALFINNNNFKSIFLKNLGNLTVSVIVLANNNLHGRLPSSIAKMAKTLNEIILTNTGLTACLPEEIELLTEMTVLGVSLREFRFGIGDFGG